MTRDEALLIAADMIELGKDPGYRMKLMQRHDETPERDRPAWLITGHRMYFHADEVGEVLKAILEGEGL